MFCPIAKNANEYPDEIALIENDNKLSYSELDDMVSSCQVYLLNSGITSGTRVTIISKNSINYIAFLFAIWRINAQAFPLNPNIPVSEIKKILKKSDTSFLICNSIEFDRSKFNDLKIIDNRVASGFPAGHVPEKVTSRLIGSEIEELINSLLIQTSGSSSESKIVVLSFSNLYYSAIGLLDIIELNRGDRWLLSLPLFHVGGIGVLIRCFLKGANVVINNKNKNLLDNIKDNKITHLSLVSTQLYKLIDEIKKKTFNMDIKAVLLGGSSIPENLIKESLNLNLPVFTSYGSSEMGSTVSIYRQSVNSNKYSSSGILLKYRDIKINEDKEILLKGKTLFKGYLSENKLVLPIDNEGWFKTGDIGYLNIYNELFITGRKDNMFISGGENIQPEEIEQILIGFAGIIESKVIPIVNEKFGFRPIAFLKTKDEKLPDKELVREHLNKILPKFKIPDAFLLWPEIDKNSLKPSIDVFYKIIKALY